MKPDANVDANARVMPAESGIETVRGVAHKPGRDVSVGIHRQTYLAVAELLHHDAHRGSLRQQE